jgi:hypothetical protein
MVEVSQNNPRKGKLEQEDPKDKFIERLFNAIVKKGDKVTLEELGNRENIDPQFLEKFKSNEQLQLAIRKKIVEEYIQFTPTIILNPNFSEVGNKNPKLGALIEIYFDGDQTKIEQASINYLKKLMDKISKILHREPDISELNGVLLQKGLPLIHTICLPTQNTALIKLKESLDCDHKVVSGSEKGTPIKTKKDLLTLIDAEVAKMNPHKNRPTLSDYLGCTMTLVVENNGFDYRTFNSKVLELFGSWTNALNAAYKSGRN